MLNVTLDEFLVSSGYHKSNADNCVYMKTEKKSNGKISFVILAIYVDDLIPISNDVDMLAAEKGCLCNRFDMVDKGETHSILGMLINRDRATITLFISQPNYLDNILKKFGMENANQCQLQLKQEKNFTR